MENANWPAAVIALITFLGVLLNYLKTIKLERRSISNSDKLDHNNTITESTNKEIKEVGKAVNGRVDLLLRTHAELSVIQAKADLEFTASELQITYAERILAKNKAKRDNAVNIAKTHLVHSYKALIIEDNLFDGEQISRVLGLANFTYVMTKNSAEVITRLVSEEHFDIAFIDLNLPGGLNGYDLIKVINMIKTEMPLFVVTGYCDRRVSDAIKLLGAIACTEKPVTLESLQKLLMEVSADNIII